MAIGAKGLMIVSRKRSDRATGLWEDMSFLDLSRNPLCHARTAFQINS